MKHCYTRLSYFPSIPCPVSGDNPGGVLVQSSLDQANKTFFTICTIRCSCLYLPLPPLPFPLISDPTFLFLFLASTFFPFNFFFSSPAVSNLSKILCSYKITERKQKILKAIIKRFELYWF